MGRVRRKKHISLVPILLRLLLEQFKIILTQLFSFFINDIMLHIVDHE